MDILNYIDKMQQMYGDKEPSSMVPEPRRTGFKSGGSYDYGSMQYKIDSVKAAYRRYKKGSLTGGRKGKMTFEQFAPIWAKENFAEGGQAGQLVQPSGDGSRPGYQVGSNQYGKFKTDKPTGFETINEKRLDDYNKKNKYINKLISDANAKDKYTSISDIAEKVKKQFRLKNAKSINISSFPDLELLESRVDKVDKVLRDMLIDDKPLKGFWHNVISERTGVPINKPGNLRILQQSPSYNSIKDQGLDLLKVNYSRKSFNYLHDFSLSDQLTKALEIKKGNPTYTGLGGEKVRTAAPSNKTMEFALRSWNNNKGSKDGPIQFFDSKGKRIVWEKGIKLPYNKVSFSYNGKIHKKSNLNTDYMKKFFPEVYNNQIAINNLSVKKIDNPFKPGSKISVKDLIKKIQVDSYGWKPRFPTLEIIHGKNGVIFEPFSNLTYGTRDLNQLENAVRSSIKAGNIKPKEGNQLIKTIYSSIQGKTGADLDQAIIDRQTSLAKNKNLTYPRIKEVGVEQFKKDLLKLAGQIDSDCADALARGGRIGLKAIGSPDVCIKKARNYMNEKLIKGIGTQQNAKTNLIKRIIANSANFVKQSLSPKELFKMENLIGKPALYAAAAVETGLVADDVLRKGKPLNVAAAESLFGFVLNLDADAARAKNLLESNVQLSPAAKEYAQSILDYDRFRKNEMSFPSSLIALKTPGSDRYFKMQEDLKNKIVNTPETGAMDYQSALDESEGTFKAKPKYFPGTSLEMDSPDAPNVMPLTNKFAKPPGTRGGRGAVKDYKIDFSLPTYDRSFTASDDFLNQYLKNIGEKPLQPGQGTLFRMNEPDQRGLFGTQERFARGGLSGGDKSGPPPESGPASQGLRSLIKNGNKL